MLADLPTASEDERTRGILLSILNDKEEGYLMRAQAANALAIYGEADAELLGAVLDLLKAAEAEIPHERPVRLLRVAIARLRHCAKITVTTHLGRRGRMV